MADLMTTIHNRLKYLYPDVAERLAATKDNAATYSQKRRLVSRSSILRMVLLTVRYYRIGVWISQPARLSPTFSTMRISGSSTFLTNSIHCRHRRMQAQLAAVPGSISSHTR